MNALALEEISADEASCSPNAVLITCYDKLACTKSPTAGAISTGHRHCQLQWHGGRVLRPVFPFPSHRRHLRRIAPVRCPARGLLAEIARCRAFVPARSQAGSRLREPR